MRRLSRFASLFKFQNKALVLMYHRINKPFGDPWNLSVSPENFEGHLRVLQENYSVVSSAELTEQIKRKKIKKNCVAITFDDGYLDNYTNAKILLEEYNIPAAFFITDGNLRNRKPFWWDELEQIIVHQESLPSTFSVPINKKTIHFDLHQEAELSDELRSKHADYKAGNPPTLRAKLYLKLWQIFNPLPKKEQEHLLQLIRSWAGFTETVPGLDSCMSAEQLRSLADNPLFTIGGHSVTHPLLSSHPEEVQYREITENRQFLENLTEKKIEHFAYPSGNYDDITIKILKDNNFSAAFTTISKPVFKKTGLFKINRFQVNNWSEDKFKRTLKKWFSS